MKHKSAILVFSLMILAGCGTTSHKAAAPAVSNQPAAAADANKGKVCKMEAKTGSKMKTRVCQNVGK